MEKIILYHGSTKIIERPLLGVGNPQNDYGLGFYCTENLELAKEWASTEVSDGFTNEYELDLIGLKILYLNQEPYHILNWLAILLMNRIFLLSQGLANEARDYVLDAFLPNYENYDVIIGYRADDSYFSFANAFLNNTISLEQLRKAMYLGKLGEQIVIKSQKAFNSLKYLGSNPVISSQYYPKRQARDIQARNEFHGMKSQSSSTDSVYVIDILRQKWTNDDARL